jgi:ATP-dependent helicase HrpA
VDDELLYAFYGSRIPKQVLSRESMKAWITGHLGKEAEGADSQSRSHAS